MPEMTKADPSAELIEAALGEVALWARPVSFQSVGPAFPEVYDRFEAERAALRDKLARRLALLSLEELRSIPFASDAPRLNPLFDPQGRFAELFHEIDDLKVRLPQDFLGAWAIAGKQIDLDYWSAFRSVTLEQAVFLSLGRDPREASYDIICQSYGRSEEADEVLLFLEDRYELIANAMGCDPVAPEAQINLTDFHAWIEEVAICVDPAFRATLRTRFAAPEDSGRILAPVSEALDQKQVLDQRERNSMAKLLTAIAIDAYGYDPDASRSKLPKEIEGICALLGLEVTTDTVRKYLRLGKQFLPKDWKPE
ncbi:hypothetical protein C8J27_110112 [Rhodobacter aestuarii]|uniref:Uncharacterized protein n=1 Tax=Rhodobacter aestuarii TaxID=453582 RepID=A0A1N7Q2U5_9RHOB|nr:hypothetical protein [Rhodobacter aestuarii]PTV94061.1 hypothetical protein C8J27_110112 [Rhodobacter aestuarii]SIT17145.1 hypothetical protein SAMN05421580_112112 [Rhodobacter aestuarii]